MTRFVDGQTVVTAQWLNAVDSFVNGGGGGGNVTTTGVQTLTNKRITARVLSSSANTAVVSINTDNCDVFKVLGQIVNITNVAVTGTPADSDALLVEITSPAGCTISWGTNFEAGDSPLPATIPVNNMLAVGFIYNVASSKWRCMSGAFPSTLSGVRIDPRVLSTSANASTVSINTDNCDVFKVLGQTVAITGFTMTGTPVDSDALVIKITGTASVAITWGTSFEASTVALPTTTAGTATLNVGFLYNSTTSKWTCVAVA